MASIIHPNTYWDLFRLGRINESWRKAKRSQFLIHCSSTTTFPLDFKAIGPPMNLAHMALKDPSEAPPGRQAETSSSLEIAAGQAFGDVSVTVASHTCGSDITNNRSITKTHEESRRRQSPIGRLLVMSEVSPVARSSILRWSATSDMGNNHHQRVADDEGTRDRPPPSHKADPSSPGVKTNLIVAPNALLKQWAEEIKKKITPEHRLPWALGRAPPSSVGINDPALAIPAALPQEDSSLRPATLIMSSINGWMADAIDIEMSTSAPVADSMGVGAYEFFNVGNRLLNLLIVLYESCWSPGWLQFRSWGISHNLGRGAKQILFDVNGTPTEEHRPRTARSRPGRSPRDNDHRGLRHFDV
ncbi:uncharacterized protein F4822DRAFT_441331 [Hypoxylon trugodes]|uniref:uncharacterized protein n=1 Tax=Hypoxylon trugodes TaxID=326681 RepID=UPI00219D7D99|nr:uncharacterized protein F4822DRAFT_441331 [Hypoxylon trugodes]KAI1392306.1 hypothetical protein F4822DRAFT_441331 [Hypoxylon trugodes]